MPKILVLTTSDKSIGFLQKTGARLKIFSNPAPQSTERVVQLVGKADAVAAGVKEVLDLIRQVRNIIIRPFYPILIEFFLFIGFLYNV